jgi:hypothetical protein
VWSQPLTEAADAGSVLVRRIDWMDDARLSAALIDLERLADDPSSFCRPFLSMFPITGAAVSTVGDLLGSETVSASDALAARVDELQFDLGEGPCWDAMVSGRPVLEPSIKDDPRSVWPAFTPALSAHPINSLFAFPLQVGNLHIGAVDLYSVDHTDLTTTQTRHAATMARAVGRHVLRRALDTIGGDHEDAGNAYSRRLIHQATGMVLAQLRIPGDDARLIIQGQAYATNRSMMDVALDIVEGRLSYSRGVAGIEDSE